MTARNHRRGRHLTWLYLRLPSGRGALPVLEVLRYWTPVSDTYADVLVNVLGRPQIVSSPLSLLVVIR